MSHFECERSAVERLGIQEILKQICGLTKQIVDFWSSPQGWAPKSAEGLLTRARLDRQMLLTEALRLWITPDESRTDGELILAWANLGSLVEGILKWFLCVYYEDYKKAENHIRKWSKEIDPDAAMLDGLRKFCATEKVLEEPWLDWIEKIQGFRNSIHAYQDREIESFCVFYSELRTYLLFIRHLNSRIPYPDSIYP